MASEVEAKWWLEKPDERIVKVLGLESIVSYDIGQIRAKAKEISGSEPEVHDYLDGYFMKDFSAAGYSAEDLDKKVRLEDGTIRFGNKTFAISVDSGKIIQAEYDGFINTLKSLFSELDKDKYGIRLREDRATQKLYLTLKVKHGIADEASEEYEFLVSSRQSAEDFLRTLGYELQPERTKVKRQERYTFNRDGIEVHAEINGVEQLGGVRFLEIEAVPKSLDKAPRIDFVYQIAKELGIQNPHLATTQGGNLENRYWQRLIQLIS